MVSSSERVATPSKNGLRNLKVSSHALKSQIKMLTKKKETFKKKVNLPFYNQLGAFFLKTTKEEILENIKSQLELFELFLDTEIASDLDLRRQMLASTIQLKAFSEIIQGFSNDQIEQESLILDEDE
jgi:chaperonin cofactor prefoldin